MKRVFSSITYATWKQLQQQSKWLVSMSGNLLRLQAPYNWWAVIAPPWPLNLAPPDSLMKKSVALSLWSSVSLSLLFFLPCRGCRRQPPKKTSPTRRHFPSALSSIWNTGLQMRPTYHDHLSLLEPNQSAKAANPSVAGSRPARFRWRMVARAGEELQPLLWVERWLKSISFFFDFV
jgi:hypothetical protein